MSCKGNSGISAVSSYADIQRQVDALKRTDLFRKTVQKKHRETFDRFSLHSSGTRICSMFHVSKADQPNSHLLAAGSVHGSVVLAEVNITKMEEDPDDGALAATILCKTTKEDGTVIKEFTLNLKRRGWGFPIRSNIFGPILDPIIETVGEVGCFFEYCVGADGSGPCAGGFSGLACGACVALCLIAN